jgi:hypothetical protein
MTTMTLDTAHGNPQKNDKGEVSAEPKSAYYALVPFAFAGDIILLPAEAVFYVALWHGGGFGGG